MSPIARLGFVITQVAGNATHQVNLQRHVESRADVVARWFPIEPTARDLWEHLPGGPTSLGFKASLRARSAMRRLERARACDALFVHTHSVAMFALDLMRRIPTVLSTDATPLGFHELATAYRHAIGPAWLERSKAAWDAKTFRAAARIVALSEWAKRSFVEDYGVPEERIEVVTLGCDTSLWVPAPDARSKDGVTRFFFVGGDFWRKGGDLLLRWAASTSAKRWEIHIVTRDPVRRVRATDARRLLLVRVRRGHGDGDADHRDPRGRRIRAHRGG
jgi:glycosyltransferase involved in cell wall biosynthesis